MQSLRSILVMVALLFTSQAQAQLFPIDREDQTAAIENYAKLLKAQGDFAKALAEARLNHAKANLVDATTAGQWVKVRQLQILVNRLDLEMRNLRRGEAQLRRKISRIESRARTVNIIMTGRVTASSLRALRSLQIDTIPAATTREAMLLPVPALGAGELLAESEGREVVSFAGGNIGQLIAHMQTHRLTLAPWGEAHQAMVDALVISAQGVDAGLQQVEDAFQQLREGADPFELTKPWELERPV